MNIKVSQTRENSNYNFDVVVEENSTSSRHKVSMRKDFYTNLKTNKKPKDVVQESFVFLLGKESKEQILPKFDIAVISQYFPDFEKHLSRNLS